MFNITISALKRIIHTLVFILVLNSCSSEFKPVTFDTISVEESYEAEITATYSKAIGDKKLSHTINTNVEKAIINSLSSSDSTSSLEDVLKGFNEEYVQFKSEFSEASEPVWELHIETEKTYQSEEIITIAISTYEYKGGAHGNDKIIFLNLNAQTGHILNQDDIIENKEEFKKIAQDYFKKSLDSEDKNLTMEDFFFGKSFQLPENFGFSDDGLVLLYNVYEVASYDQGYTEFVIPFEELKSLLKIN